MNTIDRTKTLKCPHCSEEQDGIAEDYCIEGWNVGSGPWAERCNHCSEVILTDWADNARKSVCVSKGEESDMPDPMGD